jgi:hypothetical protein
MSDSVQASALWFHEHAHEFPTGHWLAVRDGAFLASAPTLEELRKTVPKDDRPRDTLIARVLPTEEELRQIRAERLANERLGVLVRGMRNPSVLARNNYGWHVQGWVNDKHIYSEPQPTPEEALRALAGPEQQLADLMAQAEADHDAALQEDSDA